MNFKIAVIKCLTHYKNFHGRSKRSEFWWFALFSFIVSFITLLLDTAARSILSGSFVGIFQFLGFLALLPPSLAVASRRLHDINKTGWWQLILFPVYMIQVSEFLAPTSTQNPNTIIGLFGLVGFVGVIILIVFWCKPSIKSENKYGDYDEI
jgi:uncharacterized membrane protein YhaH (DUF805 family)